MIMHAGKRWGFRECRLFITGILLEGPEGRPGGKFRSIEKELGEPKHDLRE